jgi:hypothetical protein
MTPQYIEITECGTKYYYKDKAMSSFHREDGPAVEYPNGYKAWYLNNELHREDGPAIEWPNGSKDWYLNGHIHREDGPACEWKNGSKFWFINGKRHREDGPAVEYADGDKQWWLEGREYTEENFKKKTAKEIVLTMDEIAGKLGIDVSKLKIAK